MVGEMLKSGKVRVGFRVVKSWGWVLNFGRIGLGIWAGENIGWNNG